MNTSLHFSITCQTFSNGIGNGLDVTATGTATGSGVFAIGKTLGDFNISAGSAPTPIRNCSLP